MAAHLESDLIAVSQTGDPLTGNRTIMRIDKLKISSPDFEPDRPLPKEFTAVGANNAPRLVVDGIPAGTAELAIICHDPDAPLPHKSTLPVHQRRTGPALAPYLELGE